MVKRSVRELIFFVLIFLIYFLSVRLMHFWRSKTGLDPNISIITMGILYTLIIVAIWYIAKLSDNSEGFWDISAGATCKGGAYFWQGNSEEAKQCRAMAETPEGRCEISSYNCPTGYTGTPKLPFVYSPLSDGDWKSERCEDRPPCPCKDVGLCSMEKQVP